MVHLATHLASCRSTASLKRCPFQLVYSSLFNDSIWGLCVILSLTCVFDAVQRSEHTEGGHLLTKAEKALQSNTAPSGGPSTQEVVTSSTQSMFIELLKVELEELEVKQQEVALRKKIVACITESIIVKTGHWPNLGKMSAMCIDCLVGSFLNVCPKVVPASHIDFGLLRNFAI